MFQKEPYNVKGHPQEKGGGGGRPEGEKKRLTSPFVLYLIQPNGNSHPRMVSSSSRIMNPSSSVFLVPIRSFLVPSSWTHSLQIHCDKSSGPRSHSLIGLV